MKDYKKYYLLNAPPETVYNALTNAATIQLWSGAPAMMQAEAGTEFSLWDDSISGKNIEFVTGKKIVQEWYFGEQEEASIVTIILHEHKGGTSAELRHSNIPDEDFEILLKDGTIIILVRSSIFTKINEQHAANHFMVKHSFNFVYYPG